MEPQKKKKKSISYIEWNCTHFALIMLLAYLQMKKDSNKEQKSIFSYGSRILQNFLDINDYTQLPYSISELRQHDWRYNK